jgi:YidC/Oxa1 family membrane protein insertase
MVIMTTPCLEKYHIKRSLVRKDIEYVYLDHGMGSLHLVLPEGAVDAFDTVFCFGPNHIEEVRQTEEVYDLPEKRLVRTGFGLLDTILERVADEEMPQNDPKTILIAPSWQAESLLDDGVDEVIDSLLDHGYKVIVRPHPEYVKRFSNRMDAIMQRFADAPADRLEFQLDFSSNSTVYTSDIVITDWSSIATEFSYATKKPSIFINTPLKVMNHNYQRIEAVPREILMRDEIGVSVEMDELASVGSVADDLLASQTQWQDKITQVMEDNIFNIGTSGEASGQYILAALADIRRSKR